MSTQENLFQSIDYIIEARMSEIAKDITELCTVVKVYEEKDNKPNTYYVSNGQLKFDAVASEGAKYTKDTQVYVLIPGGDYSGQKLIIGSYKSENPYKYKYVTPEDEIVKAWETTKIENINQPDITSPDTYISLYQELSIPYSGFGKYDNILFTLGLSTTQLWDYNNKQTYYINFILTSKTANKTYLLRIPSTELYGNPYYLDSRYPISYILPLPLRAIDNETEEIVTLDISDITALSLAHFTQMTKDENGDEVWNVNDKIQLNTLQLALGYQGENFASQSTQIKLTLDLDSNAEPKDTDYVYNGETKQLSFDLGVISDGILAVYNETNSATSTFEGYSVHWCRYVNGYQKKDSAGNWKINQIDATGVYWETIKKVGLIPEELAKINETYKYGFTPNTEWNEDRAKVVLYKDDKSPVYESNILIFKNKQEAAPQGANKAKATDEIKLVLAAGDDGNYNIYGTDNRLISYAKKNQKTAVSIDSLYDGTPWSQTWTVTWRIPKTGTMLKVSDWDDDGDYYKKTGKDLKEITYDFSDIYSATRVHNTIYCEINTGTGGKIYRGSIQLTFGLTNTNGSDYGFNIVPTRTGGLALKPGDDPKDPNYPKNQITFKAILEDGKGQDISFDLDKLQWSWYYSDATPEKMANGGFTITRSTTGPSCIITRTETGKDGDAIRWARPRAILKATLINWQSTNGLTFNLEAYYPIGLGGVTRYCTGASRIMYNYDGELGSYDKSNYEVYQIATDGTLTKLNTGQWILKDENGDNIPTVDLNNKTQTKWQEYPALKLVKDTKEKIIGCTIVPLPRITTTIKPCYLWMAAPDDATNHWMQPILITQDTYASDMLNEWNGELNIDEKGNKILAQTIGAGIKEQNNTYTGVLMGKVKLNNSTNYGLYGFKEGELRFKFDENGKAFIGNNEAYIKFDPTISAANDQLEIKIKKGNIAGWGITSSRFEHTYVGSNNNTYRTGMQAVTGSTAAAFYAGCNTAPGGGIASSTHSNFYVRNDGYLYAKKGKIEGDFTIAGTCIAAGINAANITTGYIDADRIEAGSLDVNKIDATLITTENFSAQEINASKITAGVLNASLIKGTNNQTITFTGTTTIRGNATFTGTITATGGQIGNSTITNGGIKTATRDSQYCTVDDDGIMASTTGVSTTYQTQLTAFGISGSISGSKSYESDIIYMNPDGSISIQTLGGDGTLNIGQNMSKDIIIGKYTLNSALRFIGTGGGSMFANYNCCFTPADGYYAYVGTTSSEANRIQTHSSGPSSLNVKENLMMIDLNLVYEDMQKINMYEFDYKYTGIKAGSHDFGFIIEEMENLPYLAQFTQHYPTTWYKSGKMLIKKYSDNDLEDYEVFSTKEWDRDTYIKLNMLMNKALVNKVAQMNEQICYLETLLREKGVI